MRFRFDSAVRRPRHVGDLFPGAALIGLPLGEDRHVEAAGLGRRELIGAVFGQLSDWRVIGLRPASCHRSTIGNRR